MGESSSSMAPSRGTVRETASITKVTRNTRPLKELREMKCRKAISRGSAGTSSAGLKACQAGAGLQPGVTVRPPTSVACDETLGLFATIGKHASVLFFNLPAAWETLISYLPDSLISCTFNPLAESQRGQIKELINTKMEEKRCNEVMQTHLSTEKTCFPKATISWYLDSKQQHSVLWVPKIHSFGR